MVTEQNTIRSDGTFNGNILTDESWLDSGTYTVLAESGPNSAQATFEFGGMGGDVLFAFGGFGGIVATENIVGIEELSTLNVSEPKTATVNNGPKAEGTYLTEVMSANVCGDSLCDRPMTIKEKLEMYLLEKFETTLLEKTMKPAGFGIILDVPDFDRNFIPTHSTESLPQRGTPEMKAIMDALAQNLDIPKLNRSTSLIIDELDEQLKQLSSALVYEMFKADAASDRGDLKITIEHLKEMKSIFKEIKKLQYQKADFEAKFDLEVVQEWMRATK